MDADGSQFRVVGYEPSRLAQRQALADREPAVVVGEAVAKARAGACRIYDITPLLPIVTGAGGVAAEWTGGNISRGGNVITAGSEALLEEALAVMAS